MSSFIGAGNARGQQTTARKLRRLMKRDSETCAQSFQVTPHVAALGWIDIERRIVPSLLLKNGAEHERPPDYAAIVFRGKLFDAHGRGIRVGAGEVEPELDCVRCAHRSS